MIRTHTLTQTKRNKEQARKYSRPDYLIKATNLNTPPLTSYNTAYLRFTETKDMLVNLQTRQLLRPAWKADDLTPFKTVDKYIY